GRHVVWRRVRCSVFSPARQTHHARRRPGTEFRTHRPTGVMICAAQKNANHPPPYVGGYGRSIVAHERLSAARAALADCHLCAHHCGVNRLAGETGLCHAHADTRTFSVQTEVSDELELIPTFAIAFAGCDLRCDFCITGGPSWNPCAGESLTVSELAARAR